MICNAVEMERVNRVYRRGEFEVLAVNEVTLTIPQGKFVAIMGPSGSGKTSILNLIAGIDHASSGTVTVAGNDLGVLSDRELAGWRAHNVGLIFQFYNLIPVLSARENVELPLMLTDLPKSERRTHVEAALRVAGLADRMDHYPNQLSGGQEQRVAIARALVTDGTIIIADEPTGDLDANSASEILTLLRELSARYHKTVIMVTHDPRAERYVDSVFRMDKGILVAVEHMTHDSGPEPARETLVEMANGAHA
ncbi:MAG: ABC transporter ATP-binding protein [Candidatus Binataceae bacterium]